MENATLTEQSFWENYWENKTGKKKKVSLLKREVLKTFDQNLPEQSGLSILEIGGAFGEYLLYLTNRFGYIPSSLDFSPSGNDQTLDTFNRAGVPVTVFERDLFADNTDLPQFDVVYSLGFIEHFEDITIVIEKHLALLKPGGILLLGVPNYGGIYKPVLKKLAPSMLETHNLKIMNLETWEIFERKFKLDVVFRGYVGGFEPLNMKKIEVFTPMNQIIYNLIRILMVLFSFNLRFIRRFNSRFISGYIIGIYRKPLL